MSKTPKFTDDELRAIHNVLFNRPWMRNRFFNETRQVMAKLDVHFGNDTTHLDDEKYRREESKKNMEAEAAGKLVAKGDGGHTP